MCSAFSTVDEQKLLLLLAEALNQSLREAFHVLCVQVTVLLYSRYFIALTQEEENRVAPSSFL